MEDSSRLTPQIIRPPLSDATNRVNLHETLGVDQPSQRSEPVKSSDMMSIATSPLSPNENGRNSYLSPLVDSPAGSNRNSVSAASILSGKGKRKTHVGPWQLGKTLGKGATGRVRLAKHAVTGQTAAVKIVSKKSAAMVQSESIAAMDRSVRHFTEGGTRPMPCGIEREVVIMKLIEHPNVISLYDVWENRGELYLVLEYVNGGELFDYVSEQGPLPEEEAVRLFRQIIAGLGYCHRFNICHRDLKPENILLDSDHNIKLADFGMAALQPIGHWLNTSCGSPHYAAPEIIYGRRYRGDRADIWSCGIILYALLTGYLPFDGGDLPSTLRLVKRGDYVIPRELSHEAVDLIQRILRRTPEDRITMRSIWRHPLLQKYEKLHQAMSNHPVGPAPPLSVQDCGSVVASRQDIDIDLLRNLQTLWHASKPEALIEKLLSKEPTHERMFYNALVRFRDEQLENYEGQPLEYSASDYHHISRSPRGINRRNSSRRHSNTIRRRSHFSIRSDRDARRDSKGATLYGTAEPPSTNQATDLGRKKSMVEAVKILRAPSSDSFEEVESPEKSAFEILPNKKTRVNSVKSFQSRASRSKSRTGINSTSAPRAASYKRNVSFRHVRNRSQGATSEKSKTKAQNADLKKLTSQSSLRSNATRLDMERSPSLPAPPVMVRNSLGIKKVRDSDMAWNDETRKVSHELSLICEEAFNTSIVSTARTSSTRESGETAATSVTMASRENSHHLLAPEKPKAAQRDAPAAASTCRSYTATELAETRRKLIEHSTKDGTEKVPAYLAGVIAHLDRLIEQDKQRKLPKPEDLNDQFWTLPDSFVKPSNDPGYLPVINEELLTPFGSGKNVTSKSEVPKTSARNFARNSAHTPAARRSQDAKPTIRMVSHSSLGSIEEIKPLNVRKKTDTTHSASGLQLPEGQEAKSDTITRDSPRIKFTSSGSRESHPGGVGPIEERPKTPTRGGTGLEKKWSLFRHKSQIQTQAQEPAKPVPVPPVDDTKAKGAGAKGFFSKLIKRKQKDHDKPEEPASPAVTSPTKDTETPRPKPEPSKTTRKKRLDKSQNWFARVFQIKPATRVLALNTTNIKARREIYKILTEWQQYGLENVSLDKPNNCIHGRVGEINFLRLKPVDFSAEFYTVLEHGRHANLSLVRFRQERGAASSFGKVVDTLQVVLRQREILVQDPARAKKMAKVLDAFPT